MSELKFNCPHCSQKIQCDDAWAGSAIQCPACQGQLTVPQSEIPTAILLTPPPPPPAPPPPPLRPLYTSSSAPEPVLAPAPAPTRTPFPGSPRVPTRPVYTPQPKSKSTGKIVGICAGVVVLGVGLYFAFAYGGTWQKQLNEKSAKAAADSDGGQVGHIANLYEVLDATEVTRGTPPLPSSYSSDDDSPRGRRSSALSVRVAEPRAAMPEKDLPVIPAVWTLDLAGAKIPDGRANGMISGTNFLVDDARLDRAAQGFVLDLRQGTGPSADREILVYLRLNAGEQLAGRTWTVAKETVGGQNPQVVKCWKPDPRFAAKKITFGRGYAMKLEFGQLKDDAIPGKIFLALPDREQSVVAGKFSVAVESFASGLSSEDM